LSASPTVSPENITPPANVFTFSPRRIIFIGLSFALIATLTSLLLIINTAWIGTTFSADDKGIFVESVHRDGPAASLLKPGDRIIAIDSEADGEFDLHARDMIEDPYDLTLYREYRDFFNRQTQIHQRLLNSSFTLILDDQRRINITPARHRPLHSLPFSFWIQVLSGSIGLLIGVGVFTFRQNETAPRCLAASGMGLMIFVSAAAAYSSRELAIDGNLFYVLSLLNQYGTVLFAGFGTAVLWHYPRRLSSFPMARLLVGLYCLFALLHTLQAWETLNVGIRFPIFFIAVLNIIFAALQWRATHARPLGRAALKWLLFSWFTGVTLFLSMRLIPIALGYEPFIPQAFSWLILVVIYIGIAFGITRHRLFNLDRWVLRAWFWVFSGLAIISIDISLISLLNIDTPLSTAIALAIIGWIYFPLRQVVWARFAPGLRRIDFENIFPDILEMTLSPGPDSELFTQWRDMLQRVYTPIEIKTLSDEDSMNIHQAQLIRNGIGLRLPALPGGNALELSGAEHAGRLFNPNDERFASAVWGLFNHAVQFRFALEQGADEERQRIARDLHDDVAARVLTLVHRAEGPGYEKLARQALSALRDTIYTLNTQNPSPLEDLLADIRHETQQRLEAVSIQLHWKSDDNANDITLNARQHINLQRILQELVSNVIHHANADQLSINTSIDTNTLCIDACDNGIGDNIADWTLGKGLNNIKNRVNELNGTVDWQATNSQPNQRGCCVVLRLPL